MAGGDAKGTPFLVPPLARVVQSVLTITRKDVFELEHQVLRADGTVGWTSSRAVPLDENGQLVE